jgi:membrane-bound lytic murein transglycosylase D
MVIQIPGVSKATSKEAVLPFITKSTTDKSGGTQFYAVKKGDTFFNVAKRFSVAAKDVAEWNKLSLKTALVPGQKLTIKANTQASITASIPSFSNNTNSAHSISYIVRQGDSLAQISRKFNVSVTDLRKWNSPSMSKSLTPGKVIKLIISAGNRTT